MRLDLIILALVALPAGVLLAEASLNIPQGWAALLLAAGVGGLAALMDLLNSRFKLSRWRPSHHSSGSASPAPADHS